MFTMFKRRHFTLVFLVVVGALTTLFSLQCTEHSPSLETLPLLREVDEDNETEILQVIQPQTSPLILNQVSFSPPQHLPSPTQLTHVSVQPSPVKVFVSPSRTPQVMRAVSPPKILPSVIVLENQNPPVNNPPSKPGKFSPSPSKHPSVSPAPFKIYINHTLRGTRARSPEKTYYDTTVNTKLLILFPTEPPQNEIKTAKIEKPLHGNVTQLSPTAIYYYPDAWYTGFDQIKYVIDIMTPAGMRQKVGSFDIRVRTPIYLNKALLNAIPPNYTFSEAGKRTAVIQRIMATPAFATNIPELDTWHNKRYKTCALVGNGGSLLNRTRGKEIDAHELVVRLNSSPTTPYANDVGTKVNIAFSSGPQEVACWKRNATLPFYDIVAQLTMPNQWQKFPSCILRSKDEPVKYHALSYLYVDLVDAILNEYVKTYLPNSNYKRFRSTGLMATIALMTTCDHLSVYGFERGPNMEHHYYPSTSYREWEGHSYLAEKLFYQDIAKGGGLFEKFLEVYDLYTSFAYVVD